MDVSILADIITDIIGNTNCLATEVSEGDIKEFEKHLREILEAVEKAKHIHSKSDELVTWVQKVKAVVNDVDDLMNDLRHKKSPTYTYDDAPVIEEASQSWIRKAFQNLKVSIQFGYSPVLQCSQPSLHIFFFFVHIFYFFVYLLTVKIISRGRGSIAQSSQNVEPHHLQVPQLIKTAGEDLKSLASEAQKLSSFEEENMMITIGREKEKKDIIDRLTKSSESDSVVVVTVVGVAGIGKTKLARVVCGDEKVRSRFHSQIWLHGINDVEFIIEHVNESCTNRKRFLLVLDDLRVEIHEDWLEKLKHKLNGAILITARGNYKIASSYDLHGLKVHESWSLFRLLPILSSNNKEQDNEKEIVKDCGGVPLAIITLARLLNSRGSQAVKPEEVAAFKDFVQKQHRYFELPTHQKLCFAYFSLFPRDRLINSEFLIRLWVAEGFLARNISSNNYEEQEKCGQECLEQLDHHFLEKVEKDKGVVVRSYRMKPLMHDLARIVANDENVIINSGAKKFGRGVLRASFDLGLDVRCGIPYSLFKKAKKLRTILLLEKTDKGQLSPRPYEVVSINESTCEKLFHSFKYLRLLDLHELRLMTVPHSIGEMKHLRYLDLSDNKIKKLPSCITQLSYLQTLKLSSYYLKELPKDLKNLSDLVHLDIQECFSLTHMPYGISKLSSLQTLSLFAASKNDTMGGLEQLKDLNKIRGKLEITNLEQMKIPSTSPEYQFLNHKEHLQQLILTWDYYEERKEKKKGNERSKKDDDDEDRRSLDCLVPHQNLRELNIHGYNSRSFSNLLFSTKGLFKLYLTDCPKCKVLPSLDKLPNLRVLHLWRLPSLKFISEKSDTPVMSINNAPFLTSLKKLVIWDCPELVGWWENETWEKGTAHIPVFTSISTLDVKSCPKLDYLPLCPRLDKKLNVMYSSVVPIQHTIHANATELKGFLPFSNLKSMLIKHFEKCPGFFNFTSLENLHICGCRKLKFLPQGFKSMKSLKNLIIEDCPKLELDCSGTEWEGLKKLHYLALREISLLTSLPPGIKHLTSLEHLELKRCRALNSLDSIRHLTSLDKLEIFCCHELASLPKEMEELKSLTTLRITGCSLLELWCEKYIGHK